jgi:hypothetical protein
MSKDSSTVQVYIRIANRLVTMQNALKNFFCSEYFLDDRNQQLCPPIRGPPSGESDVRVLIAR